MSSLRRPVPLLATAAVVSVLTGGILGATTHSDAAPAPAATTVAVGNPKVPTASPSCGSIALRPGARLLSSQSAGCTLQSGGLGAGAGNSLLTFSPYSLTLQTDGNLVEYRTDERGRQAVWSTGTAGAATPVSLTFQTDGNVVLRDRTNRALWSTGTAGRAAAYFDVYGNGQVVTQDSTGRILSAHGRAAVGAPGIEVSGALSPAWVDGAAQYRSLEVQSDGNLVEYVVTSGGGRRAVWSTRTAGVGPVQLTAQSDGNLVLRQVSTNRAVWASGTHGPTGYYQFDVQNDGSMALYRTDGTRRVQAVWSTARVR